MKSAYAENLVSPSVGPVLVPLRIAVVDETDLFRECVAAALNEERGCAIALEASSPRGALDRMPSVAPDVFLISVTLPEEGALELIQWISAELRDSKVLVVGSEEEDAAEILECIEEGAAGYVSRNGSLKELKQNLRATVKGETRCSPRLARSVFSRLTELANRNREESGREQPVLTVRELEILELVAEGLSNKEIAKKLIISLHTVKNHVHNILEKLEVSGRYAAVSYAYDRRWLRRPWR